VALYWVAVDDSVETERATSALNRFAETLAMGPVLVTLLPVGFPDTETPNLAFHIRYLIDQIMAIQPVAP